jgi:DNA-binding transcriptional LysR family regulator
LLALSSAREKPAGALRLTSSEHAAQTRVWPAIERIVAAYPDIAIELTVESGLSDIVAEKFDAGVRLGEHLAKDMIAVRIGPPLRMAAVAAPSYFAVRKKPLTPHDLSDHDCINLRLVTAGGLYTWEFSKDGRELNVRVAGQLTFNRASFALQAAREGRGLGFLMEDMAARDLADGSLVRVLEDWCEPFEGYHLYYPSRRHQSPVLALLIEALRWREG